MKSNNLWALFFLILAVLVSLFIYGIIPLSSLEGWAKAMPSIIFIIIALLLFLFRNDSKIEEVKK